MYENMRLGRFIKNALRRFIRECRGPTATEYAVLLVLIVFGALAAISLLGSFVGGSVQSTAQALPSGASEEGSEGDSGGSKSKKQKKPPRRRGRGGRKGRGRASNMNSRTSGQDHYVLAEPAGPKVFASSSTLS